MLKRILVAVIGLPLLLAVILLLPAWGTAALFAAACAIAAYEMLWRTGILKNKRIVVYTAVTGAAVLMGSWLYCGVLPSCACENAGRYFRAGMLALVLVYITLLFCEILASHGKLPFTSLAAALFSGLVYPLLLGSLVRLRCMDEGSGFAYYTLSVFLLSMIADSGAYFAGRAFGKHKLAPVISPKKTVEGVIGGVIANVLFMLLYMFLISRFGGVAVHYWTAPVYGILGAAASVAGDLSLSAVKRQTGIKDYGNLLPGHGGILDRFDSTMLVAPLTELLVILIPFAEIA